MAHAVRPSSFAPPKPRIQIGLSLLLLIAWFAQPASGGCDVWTSNGPYGGWVNDILVDPQDSDRIYVGLELGGLYRSTDAGQSWTRTAGNLTNTVRDLAADVSTTPTTIYATSDFDSGLLKSTDNGVTWSELNSMSEPFLDGVAIDPTSPSTIYAASFEGRFYKSTNGGTSWNESTIGSSGSGQDNISVAVSPDAPATVLVGRRQEGIYRSTNGGGMWTNVLAATDVREIVFDPTTVGTVYAAADEGVFVSTDSGANWTPSGLGAVDVNGLSVHPSPHTVWAATPADGVYSSTDGGASWTPMSSGISDPSLESIRVDPSSGSTIYAGGVNDGVFKTSTSGASWSSSSQGIVHLEVRDVVFDPFNPSVLYAASSIRVSRSNDAGTSWADLPGSPGGVVLAASPVLPNTVFAIDRIGTVLLSSDSGANWTIVGMAPITDVVSFVAHPSDPSVLYAASDFGGVYRSFDGGATWNESNTGFLVPGARSLQIDPAQPDTLYVLSVHQAGGDAVYKSTDSGASWSESRSGIPDFQLLNSLFVDPSNPSRLFASTNTEVYRSFDAGATWSLAGPGLPPFLFLADFAAGPGASPTIYLTTVTGSVSTTDFGSTWGPLPNLPNSFLSRASLLADPSVPGLLHLGSASVQSIFLDDPFELIDAGDDDNDDTCFGNFLAFGEAQSHNHCDPDWTWFNGTAGQTYRIETLNLSPTSDTTLSVEVACSGDVIAFNDDAVPGATLASRIELTPPIDATYDILTQQFFDGYGVGDSYDIRVRDITGLFFEDGFESGDVTSWSSSTP